MPTISITGAGGVGAVAQGYCATVVGVETATAVAHGTSHLLREHALVNQAEVQYAAGLTTQQAVDQARDR